MQTETWHGGTSLVKSCVAASCQGGRHQIHRRPHPAQRWLADVADPLVVNKFRLAALSSSSLATAGSKVAMPAKASARPDSAPLARRAPDRLFRPVRWRRLQRYGPALDKIGAA